MKKCTKCGEIKPFEEFNRWQRSSDGHNSSCRACHNDVQRRYRVANPEKNKESQHKYYLKNVEKIKEKNRQYCQNHPEKRQKTQKGWYDKNPGYNRKYYENNVEQISAHNRAYAKANASQLAVAKAKWIEANKDKVRAIKERWLKNHPEKRKESAKRYSHRRRMLITEGRCDLTLEQWENIQAFYNYRCAFCKRKAKLTQDHVIAITKGGEHTASNIIPLCQSCNSSKGNREVRVAFQPHLLMAEAA